MKLHRNLAEAVVLALESIFEKQEVAERAVAATFGAHSKWGKRDRAWVAETIYEIVRWRRLLAFAAQDETPWGLLAAHLARGNVAFPAWPELAAFNAGWLRTRLELDAPRVIRESIPDWLDELGARELGARWDVELRALNESAPVWLRANALKISRDELRARLAQAGVETQIADGLPDALRLLGRSAVTRLEEYKAGLFEIQDGASQMVAPFAGALPGMKIVDACAGAGGKTLHLAAQMENQGELKALDVSAPKLRELERRASRAGAKVETALAEAQTIESLRGWADRLVLDMPCSGSGTLRRQPDLKWRLSPGWLERLRQTQREILGTYREMVAPGGELVYATCSLLPSENERQIEWFLGEFAGWKLVESRVISTAETGLDGFFMARLGRF